MALDLHDYFITTGWECIHQLRLPEKPGAFEPFDDLDLSYHSRQLLRLFAQGMYRHQKRAIQQFLAGNHVCLTTSTASGKSLIFQICAIEQLVNDASARILAIYPLKALASEQLERWSASLYEAGLPYRVGRIDGGIPVWQREEVLQNNHIVVITPDVIHAWLLANLGKPLVLDFLRHIRLVVLDEAHMYSGVFGSNAAFLFRRMEHAISKAGGTVAYIAASATIKHPDIHMQQLVGRTFTIIGTDLESTPKQSSDVVFVNPPASTNILAALSGLMNFIADHTSHQFIAFVDSRKQTEYLAAITMRQAEPAEQAEQTEPVEETDDVQMLDHETLTHLHIYPYRSGYEEADRKHIQDQLTTGALKGIISTSALEMGLDIPCLTLGILYGIPNSATSFLQRIGRVGRHQHGVIIIVNNGSVMTRSIFRNPEALLQIPLSESTLYLENRRIQYIHALCLARQGGEDDAVKSDARCKDHGFQSSVDFPAGFRQLCQMERRGEVPVDLHAMKVQAGAHPHQVFPLRDVDVQYQVEARRGVEQRKLGSLSYSQIMREAYPGAVYYYRARSFRVHRVNTFKKLVEVRGEKKYTTRPIFLPTRIFPDLSADHVHATMKFGDLVIIECHLHIRESLAGYGEQRGRTSVTVKYPLPPDTKLCFEMSRFTRNYFTSGVLIHHPLLNRETVEVSRLATLLFESFLMLVPFDRQDVHMGYDTHRLQSEAFGPDDSFLAIYDQTYGSLRLTGRLMDVEMIPQLLNKAIDIVQHDDELEMNPDTSDALRQMRASLAHPLERVVVGTSPVVTATHLEPVILPGSVGLNISRENEEFLVDSVVFHTELKRLMYKGKHLSQQQAKSHQGVVVTIPVKHIQAIPGESQTGFYNYETGQLEDMSG